MGLIEDSSLESEVSTSSAHGGIRGQQIWLWPIEIIFLAGAFVALELKIEANEENEWNVILFYTYAEFHSNVLVIIV